MAQRIRPRDGRFQNTRNTVNFRRHFDTGARKYDPVGTVPQNLGPARSAAPGPTEIGVGEVISVGVDPGEIAIRAFGKPTGETAKANDPIVGALVIGPHAVGLFGLELLDKP